MIRSIRSISRRQNSILLLTFVPFVPIITSSWPMMKHTAIPGSQAWSVALGVALIFPISLPFKPLVSLSCLLSSV